MNENELMYAMALTRIPTIGCKWATMLYEAAETATALYENRKEIKSIIPDATEKICELLAEFPIYVEQVKPELEFMHHYSIKGLVWGDEDYPIRLRECPDAPLVLFQKGNANLNRQRIISVVGTRRCTEYGRDLCRTFLRDLSTLDSDILVVSGLAYGIDAQAHEQALQNHMDTVGVLAHGLDRIYPQSNRGLASRMVECGALLTEYFSGTDPDAFNFVQRNRIVAGISDCCIVVESQEKGGSLITADLAQGYHRDVFAFPGRTIDRASQGCNNLIANHVAVLISGAEDFMKQMRWTTVSRPKVIERELFVELNEEEQLIVNVLKETDGLPINIIAVRANLSVSKVTSLLLKLEIKGLIKTLVGGTYKLLG